MRKMTEADLWSAFAGESQAHVKYLAFAQRAEEEGYPNLARLFKAISHAELVHAHNHLRVLSGLGSSTQNLIGAIDGENYEVDEMYPAFDAVAALQQEKGALGSIHFAIEAEKIHAGLYSQAKQSADNGQDVTWKKVYICPVCGFTAVDEAPDKCPVCGAPREKFVVFS